MIKYEIDENDFLTGNYAEVGGFPRYFECEKLGEDVDLKTLKVVDGTLQTAVNPKTKKKEIENQIIELKKWFDNYYAQHEQKYRRLHTLGQLTDDGKNAYDKLVNLYAIAEEKRKQIQQKEEVLKTYE